MARGCPPEGAAHGAKTPRPHLLLPWRSVAISWLRWMCGVRAGAATSCLRVPARPLLTLARAVCIGLGTCPKCPPLSGSRALIGCSKQVARMTPFGDPFVQFTSCCHTRPRPALSVFSASFSCQLPTQTVARWLFWAQPSPQAHHHLPILRKESPSLSDFGYSVGAARSTLPAQNSQKGPAAHPFCMTTCQGFSCAITQHSVDVQPLPAPPHRRRQTEARPPPKLPAQLPSTSAAQRGIHPAGNFSPPCHNVVENRK